MWIYDTQAERRWAVLWPAGYRAAFHPLRIYDSDGVLVWREGDERALSGGPSTVHVDRIPRACRTGDLAWWLPWFRLPSGSS